MIHCVAWICVQPFLNSLCISLIFTWHCICWAALSPDQVSSIAYCSGFYRLVEKLFDFRLKKDPAKALHLRGVSATTTTKRYEMIQSDFHRDTQWSQMRVYTYNIEIDRCMHVYIYMHVYIFMYMTIHMYIHVHEYTYTDTKTRTHTCTCTYSEFMYAYVCIYIYICL